METLWDGLTFWFAKQLVEVIMALALIAAFVLIPGALLFLQQGRDNRERRRG